MPNVSWSWVLSVCASVVYSDVMSVGPEIIPIVVSLVRRHLVHRRAVLLLLWCKWWNVSLILWILIEILVS